MVVFLSKVGMMIFHIYMQVWLGSLLLGDWILHNPSVYVSCISSRIFLMSYHYITA